MDEQPRWLGGLLQADPVRARQARPPEINAEVCEQIRSLDLSETF
ncbi:hypothetical protein ACS5PJ_15630 [Pseudarthrobacter sp. YS3]|jgi:hypothetical protein